MRRAAQLIEQADGLRSLSQWAGALALYREAVSLAPAAATLHHNMALCLHALGQHTQALENSRVALSHNRGLWQSRVVAGRSLKALGQPDAAWEEFAQVLRDSPQAGMAAMDLADLAMNEFGDPLQAAALAQPWLSHAEHGRDAQLTTLLSALYDRDFSAAELVARIKVFAQRELVLDTLPAPASPPACRKPGRLRIGLLSPLFCASPVYFLTIAGWRRMAAEADIIVFDRGTRHDWATEEFRRVAHGWQPVAHLGAAQLAQVLLAADLDVLYDLGGWMDPVGLQALSVKPARRQYKWVGGQSATTGLHCFDGWIGDEWQSPTSLQHLYTEPLLNLPGGYASYTPPPYLPKSAKRKDPSPVIFANPAKLSRAFLRMLAGRPGRKCFVHRQYRHARVRARIEAVLGPGEVEYVCPASHQEALEAVNAHAVMLDTFPYSGGLTAREAVALGTRVKGSVGELFCERHTAWVASTKSRVVYPEDNRA
ncbi:Predicted O-linked N-acetylglucosamine transferase, SPINDLY family [Noviherbaspirillum humi]|uniref:Predicted O-linked N-acetylglucosamine transferase, SPINDLY family n=1 Tax=Noviherbaspirillum humi TaxID=1688639 RepID=A0A239K1N1_9BURK|nr:hypothetical protein [Noviherbaspirillum humi]SNT11930.1 Predicted O-linked N-acetylglucosamine transferase, SPINDLY family [Noviherbaspirillum humi]